MAFWFSTYIEVENANYSNGSILSINEEIDMFETSFEIYLN